MYSIPSFLRQLTREEVSATRVVPALEFLRTRRVRQWSAVCFSALLVLGAALRASAVDTPTPDILILNSYAPGYQWSDDETAGLLSVLHRQYGEIEPVVEYLDFKRFADPVRERWLIEDIADKCRQRPPRLIITLDDPAFDFALKYRARLGGEVPIVFGGVNHFTPAMIAGQRKITGVAEESDHRGTFELIRCLRPAARHVLVISSETESGVDSRKAFAEIAPRYAGRYEFEFFSRWTNAELITRVANLPDDWVGLILDVTRDATGHHNYKDGAFSQALSSRSSVPIFLTARPPGNNDWSVYPWDGIGGGMIVAEVHGMKVGEMAARILAGEEADAIPVVPYSPPQLEVDQRQMQRFGLSTDLLPPGTKVINAPVTFYQVNRARIIGAGVVLSVLCGIIVALSLNILWRHRAERALSRVEEQLRSAQKLEAIGLLAGGVAHDFNNILQVIRGHAGFLQETVAAWPQAGEDVKVIQEATARGSRLTQQLLVFSRKQTLKPQPVEANQLVGGMAQMLQRLLGEHIELQVAPLPVPCTFVADKGQLEQVLMNLCLNARDAMPSGGRIRIALERIDLAGADTETHPELEAGPHLVLTVSDSGVGMPPEVVRRIFEPFFTTKVQGKGTGLGLAVVYGIVRQHEGAIRVYSEAGNGTVFKIYLPLKSGEMGATDADLEDALPRGHGTILLAEDDTQVREIGARILTRNGFQVVTAVDGAEAEALISRHHATLRLAVLDVLMPKRNGRQVFDFIRSHHPNIRVLFCSGYSAEMLPAEIAPAAGLALINKPYSERELINEVHRLLQG